MSEVQLASAEHPSAGASVGKKKKSKQKKKSGASKLLDLMKGTSEETPKEKKLYRKDLINAPGLFGGN